MPQFKLMFSGDIRKVEHRQAGAKQITEVQMCRKNYTKEGEEPTFTWIKATIWEPREWQLQGLQVGKYISGVGEFTMRSFEKDGVKRQAAEIRVSSMDLDVPKPSEGHAPSAPVAPPAPRIPAPGPAGSDDCPFARPLIADIAG